MKHLSIPRLLAFTAHDERTHSQATLNEDIALQFFVIFHYSIAVN